MKWNRTFGLVAILAAGVASAGYAAMSTDEAGNPTGAPAETAIRAPGHRSNGQIGPHGNGQVPLGGTTVGPGSGNNDTRLGYAKGEGENSPVGKD